ncbi:60S ribosomal subunit assembly or modification protein [Blastocladiella emersonii ATCC 22665]|nr:60S ribosomal subunit assembly or modification protein [Blastocladiella emersonii ATCC 22665]
MDANRQPKSSLNSREEAEDDAQFAEGDEVAEMIDVPDMGGADEPMDDDDDMDADEDEAEQAGGDELVEIKDDSVQGFFAHQKPVYCVAMHPTSYDIILSGGEDEKAYLWSAHTGETLHQFDGHTDSVVACGFNHDGTLCATAGMDAVVQVYVTATGQCVSRVEASDEIVCLDWHPKGNALLAGTNDGQVWMLSMPKGNIMGIFAGVHTGPVTMAKFTPDGKRVVSGAEDGTFAVWDPKSFTPVLKWTPEDGRWFQEEAVTSLAVNPASTLCLVGGSEGTARVVSLTDGTLFATFNTHTSSIESIAFSPKLPLATLASTDNKVTVIDVTRWIVRSTLVHDDAAIKAEFTDDGLHIVTCSADKSVRVWDARTATLVVKWVGHHDPILCMAISPLADLVVAGGDEGVVLVFSPPQQQQQEQPMEV